MMARPNFIYGMKLHGIGRGSKEKHYKKLRRYFYIETCKIKKDQREERQREYANRVYSY